MLGVNTCWDDAERLPSDAEDGQSDSPLRILSRAMGEWLLSNLDVSSGLCDITHPARVRFLLMHGIVQT